LDAKRFTDLCHAANLVDTASLRALRRVYVDNDTWRRAAELEGIATASIATIKRRFPRDICKCCGAALY